MEAVPINSVQGSDVQPTINHELIKPPNSTETDITIAQLPKPITSPPAPLTPSSAKSIKRKRLQPARYDALSINAVKKRSYSKDKVVHDPSRTSLSSGKEKAGKDASARVQISQTMIRAREIQLTLGNEHPSFIKTMVKSHVISCFWMGLPLPFSRLFLPKQDCLMVMEDADGKQCHVKYIAYRFGLSGGWKNFAIRHKLLEGDVLIFQLVESCKFKVHIIRANDSKEVNGDVNVNVINLDADAEHITPAPMKTYSKSKGRKCPSSSSIPLTKVKRKYKRSKPPTQPSSHTIDHAVVNSQVQGASLEPKHSSKEVKTFEEFHIMINKRCIDSDLCGEIRKDYYDLCIGRNEILHDGVHEGLYYKLVAGMIGETVNIANMLRNCKLTTRKEELDVWDSSLKSFEFIGMKVGFLRDRIRTLANFVLESEDAKRYVEAKEERIRNANEIEILKTKLVELYKSNRKIDEVMDDLKEKAERHEVEFQKKVDAPW